MFRSDFRLFGGNISDYDNYSVAEAFYWLERKSFGIILGGPVFSDQRKKKREKKKKMHIGFFFFFFFSL
jgi:hypothetical protein